MISFFYSPFKLFEILFFSLAFSIFPRSQRIEFSYVVGVSVV